MKLTKSQRLFIKVGEELYQEKLERFVYSFEGGGRAMHFDEEYGTIIANHKRKRKKLLREAIEAAKIENETIYGEGLAEAFKSHLE